jgi:DNA-binding XRE family transcriptional regulator
MPFVYVDDGTDSHLVAVLHRQNLSQKQFAELLRVSVRQVNAWCRKRHIPNVPTAIRIARALETTVEEIWGEEVNG